jgi:hypothetical protein
VEDNPYSAPAFEGGESGAPAGGVQPGAVDQLARTKPWVRFMAVLILLGVALMSFLALVMLVVGFAAPPDGSQITKGMTIALSLVYLLLGALYAFPGIRLWIYASRIAVLVRSGRAEDLVAALDAQRAFWKMLGIMVIAGIALYVLGIAVAVAAGVFANLQT